ncbi:MAG: chemotaxis protein CheA [Myxococcota bacterium]
MSAFASALAELTTLLVSADVAGLVSAARKVRSAVPADNEDLAALADGVVAVLATYGEDIDRELLVAQLENDIAGMSMLAAAGTASTGASAARAAPAEVPRGLPEWVDAAMLSEFLDAQRHGLTEVEEILLEAASAGDSEKLRIARILHTLKGESSTVGFSELEELYHVLEDRLGEVPALTAIVDEALAVKDWVLLAVPALLAGNPAPPGRTELLARLRAEQPVAVKHEAARSTGPEAKTTIPSDPEVLALFGEFHDEAMESLTQADEMLVSIESGVVDAPTVDALFRVFHTIKGLAGFLDLGAIGALAHAAETLLDDARNDLATLTEDRLDLLLRATTMIRNVLEATRAAVASGGEAAKIEGFDVLLDRLVTVRKPKVRDVPRELPPMPVAQDADGDDAAERRAGTTTAKETIKVDLARVDSLVETIGELVIVDAMVMGSADLRSTVSPRTRHQLAQLSKIVRDLQRQGLALRMVPLRGVFQKMSRLVRDLSRRSGKPIRLDLAGQDAEMDRSLAERLGDPLVHMMRNAVDHGVESVEARRKAGKPETATLRLSAYHEGGNIIIELSDDGKGLDRDAILRKATERGLVMEGASLTDREVYELIFAPGFSTAVQVTELSGRGVGMDVVKRTVDELRGRIQIATEPGRGTTFKLVLPLTLAIIDGMLLVAGSRRYVLPTLAIVESLQPRAEQIHRFAGGAQVLDVRGEQLPLVDLGRLLGIDALSSVDPTRGFVVVVDGLNSRFGLLVDDLIGQQQVVIKHIDATVNHAGLFSGAAILSDGHVGLILNPAALRADEPRIPAARMMPAPTPEAK